MANQATITVELRTKSEEFERKFKKATDTVKKNTKPRYKTDLDRASTALMREDFRNTISSLFLFPKNVSLSQISCSWCSSIPFTGPFCCFCCFFLAIWAWLCFLPFFCCSFLSHLLFFYSSQYF